MGTRKLPCVIMRGGTSRGAFLLAEDLPSDSGSRDRALLALMGSPHPLQIDGLGGAQPQTSKVAIVSRSTRPGIDVDYLFAQVATDRAVVDTRPNCGNMLAGVGPFAIEQGLVRPADGTTVVRIHNVNTGARVEAEVLTPGGAVTYDGDTVIDGVPGSAAPIRLSFSDFSGGKTGRLLPTGARLERIGDCEATAIDSAMPMLLLDGRALGLPALPDAAPGLDATLAARIERCRREAGRRMGLGDVSDAVIPKVGLLFASETADIGVAYLTPWSVHKSLAVTGAIAIATAATLAGTVAARLARRFGNEIRIEHPTGVLQLGLTRAAEGLAAATVLRTARRIFEGQALLPDHLFDVGAPRTK